MTNCPRIRCVKQNWAAIENCRGLQKGILYVGIRLFFIVHFSSMPWTFFELAFNSQLIDFSICRNCLSVCLGWSRTYHNFHIKMHGNLFFLEWLYRAPGFTEMS
jgi:hypothetical protein